MPSREPSERSELRSRRQMTELAVGAIAALQEGGFVEEIDLLCERVFRLPPDRLFDTEASGQCSWSLAYKPMVELLLLHVRDAAAREGPADARSEDIRWAIGAAGF